MNGSDEEAVMSPHEAAVSSNFRMLAAGITSTDPKVQRFVAKSVAEIELLASKLSRAEQRLAAVSDENIIERDHSCRLETLIDDQASEVTELYATLGRVRAVADLAEWAATLDGEVQLPTVRVDDLRRALESATS